MGGKGLRTIMALLEQKTAQGERTGDFILPGRMHDCRVDSGLHAAPLRAGAGAPGSRVGRVLAHVTPLLSKKVEPRSSGCKKHFSELL